MGLPLVALVGYTNAGKSTILNRLSRAGVLAENMLFATLDPTTRKVRLPKPSQIKQNAFVTNKSKDREGSNDESTSGESDGNVLDVIDASTGGDVTVISDKNTKGPEVLLTDTVGFISKLPSNLVAAFR